MAITWAVELEAAVQTAMATWLRSTPAGLGANVATGQPAVTIYDEWPSPNVELQMPSLAILRAGAPDVDELDPSLVLDDVTGAPVRTAVAGQTNLYTYWWRMAQATLPLELAIWASSKAMRGDTVARLRSALVASKASTLATYISTTNAALQAAGKPLIPAQDPVENSIVCQCASPWDLVLVDYAFSHRVDLDESPTGAKLDEWRASMRGEATYDVIVPAQSAGLAQVVLKAFNTIGPSLTPAPGQLSNLTTITATGATYSRG